MFSSRLVVAILTLWAVASETLAASSIWVQGHRESRQRLVYRPDEFGNTIVDFSQVGYEGGDREVPVGKVPVAEVVLPRENLRNGDDTDRIQAAIDRVAQLTPNLDGFRGAVLLHRGEYLIKAPLNISSSGVVLRGEGDEDDGTIVNVSSKRQIEAVLAFSQQQIAPVVDDEKRPTVGFHPAGTRRILLKKESGARPLVAGDDIIVSRIATKAWINLLGMDRIPSSPVRKIVQWYPADYNFHFERRVLKVENVNSTNYVVHIDVPLVLSLDEKFGIGFVSLYKNLRVSRIGVELIRFVASYARGKEEEDEEHAWNGVVFANVQHSWIANVTALHFGYACAYFLSGTKYSTVMNTKCLKPVSIVIPERRYHFHVDGSMNLALRCHAEGGRHSFVQGRRAPGPNAFVMNTVEGSSSDDGPHQRFAVGTLWDSMDVKMLAIRNRGNFGSGHGWSGAGSVVWNPFMQESGMLWIESPPLSTNWAIGATGHGARLGNGTFDSFGRSVTPPSLYYAQLTARRLQYAPGLIYPRSVWLDEPPVVLGDPSERTLKRARTLEGNGRLNSLEAPKGLHEEPMSVSTGFVAKAFVAWSSIDMKAFGIKVAFGAATRAIPMWSFQFSLDVSRYDMEGVHGAIHDGNFIFSPVPGWGSVARGAGQTFSFNVRYWEKESDHPASTLHPIVGHLVIPGIGLYRLMLWQPPANATASPEYFMPTAPYGDFLFVGSTGSRTTPRALDVEDIHSEVIPWCNRRLSCLEADEWANQSRR